MAVTTVEGTSTVTVRSDDGDEERTVDTGLTSGSMVEITSGLEAGEQVVVTVPGARDGGGPDGGPPAFSADSDSGEAP
jgi:macrolide-specific efflux system membrane fusion protein